MLESTVTCNITNKNGFFYVISLRDHVRLQRACVLQCGYAMAYFNTNFVVFLHLRTLSVRVNGILDLIRAS